MANIKTDIIKKRLRLETPKLQESSAVDLDKVILPSKYLEQLLEFVDRSFRECPVNYEPAQKVAVPLSGGLDSSTALYIGTNAVGKKNTVAVVMKHDYMTQGEKEDRRHAEIVIKDSGISVQSIDITQIVDSLWGLTSHIKDEFLNHLLKAEALPRARAIAMHTYCSVENWISLDTANLTEVCLANMTKGDYSGHVDLFEDLLKCEVRALARQLNVPEEIIEQTKRISEFSSTFEDMFGASYRFLDPVVYHYIYGADILTTTQNLGHPLPWIKDMYARMDQSRFIDSRPISYLADYSKDHDGVASWIEGIQERTSKVIDDYPLEDELKKCRAEYMPASIKDEKS